MVSSIGLPYAFVWVSECRASGLRATASSVAVWPFAIGFGINPVEWSRLESNRTLEPDGFQDFSR